MRDKSEINDIVSKLVEKFDLQSASRDGVIEGEVLVDKLTDFIYKTTKVSLEERKEAFKETLTPYLDSYGRKMLNEFYFYWTATKEGGYKMRYEREKSWNLAMRLNTFKINEVKFNAINIVSKLK